MSFPYQDQLRSLQRAYLLGPACLLPCPWELKLFYFKPMSNFYITRLASLEAYLLGMAQHLPSGSPMLALVFSPIRRGGRLFAFYLFYHSLYIFQLFTVHA